MTQADLQRYTKAEAERDAAARELAKRTTPISAPWPPSPPDLPRLKAYLEAQAAGGVGAQAAGDMGVAVVQAPSPQSQPPRPPPPSPRPSSPPPPPPRSPRPSSPKMVAAKTLVGQQAVDVPAGGATRPGQGLSLGQQQQQQQEQQQQQRPQQPPQQRELQRPPPQ